MLEHECCFVARPMTCMFQLPGRPWPAKACVLPPGGWQTGILGHPADFTACSEDLLCLQVLEGAAVPRHSGAGLQQQPRLLTMQAAQQAGAASFLISNCGTCTLLAAGCSSKLNPAVT